MSPLWSGVDGVAVSIDWTATNVFGFERTEDMSPSEAIALADRLRAAAAKPPPV